MMIGNLNSQGTQGFPLTYVRFFRDGGKAEPTFLSVEEMAASADGSLHAPIQSGFKKIVHWRLSPEVPELAGFYVDSALVLIYL